MAVVTVFRVPGVSVNSPLVMLTQNLLPYGAAENFMFSLIQYVKYSIRQNKVQYGAQIVDVENRFIEIRGIPVCWQQENSNYKLSL